MKPIDDLKQFVFNGILVEDSFKTLEKQGIIVKSDKQIEPLINIQESDFDPITRYNASRMASVYVAFFCLENAVRDLITERLSERHGPGWWESHVPTKIKDAVVKLKEKEDLNRYHTQRSTDLIGYTMFGNLGQIIIATWDDFLDLLPNQPWVTSRFTDLEMSRNVIMHTGILPEIEIERIESIARDWIRQVG